ncbi:unnamed protein product [Rotaria sordida]|uniref:LTD domain-containing protein n=1 Tax=Rotaria sordida TaxID=392033 RepID=A0A813Z4Q0_9BILA|nr:unnamed protein product [Rotaria sordida]CAF3755113.1 unnamed protein product [Rotaria sordida]
MSRTIQDNAQNLNNNTESSNTTKIRRTLIERGIRTVGDDRDNKNGSLANISAIRTRNKQHEDDQRELQELNVKFAIYLDHVQNLENYNGQLLAELQNLKENWSNDTNQLHTTYGPDLQSLRGEIDNSLRDQVLQELLSQRYEYDIWQTQQRINALDGHTSKRLHVVQQELNQSIDALEQIKNQYDRYSTDLVKQRTNVDSLYVGLDGLQNELVNHRLERIMIENEIQTLREQILFEDAMYQTQREDFLSLSTPVVDVSKFYHDELIRAIFDIRHDFEILAASQINGLEEYYRTKMEEIQETIQDNERKRLLDAENKTIEQTFNSESLIEIENVHKQLRIENIQLQTQFDNILDDLTRIQNEHIYEQQKLDEELNQLQQDIAIRQTNMNSIVENNVSLRFELSTYRSLLTSEEQRLYRLKQEKQLQTSPSLTDKNLDNLNQNHKNYKMQKVSTKTSATGSIIFDSIDFINDCIVIKNDRFTGKDESFKNWSLRRKNDEQPELVYRFPSSFVLKPGHTVRILSRRSPQSTTNSESDVFIANQIDTWGLGQVMITSLNDNNNEEVASMTQTVLKD